MECTFIVLRIHYLGSRNFKNKIIKAEFHIKPFTKEINDSIFNKFKFRRNNNNNDQPEIGRTCHAEDAVKKTRRIEKSSSSRGSSIAC